MKVSVVIPVKNGADTLDRCLQSLRDQSIGDELEIIILDSMSKDGSREIASRYKVTLFDIPAGSFNHGHTRNLGVHHASGELIYLTVQDAWISDEAMLEKMTAHFIDPKVQSVSGMQATPHELDKNPARWFRRFTEPVPDKRFFAPCSFEQLPAAAQLATCRWDNVNTMYRRTALEKLPFVTTSLGEDIIWAKQALQRGLTVVRDPSLVVYHYHHHSFSYTFRLKYSEYYVIENEFNLLPPYPNAFKEVLQATYTIVRNKQLSVIKKAGWISHNIFFIIADLLCVFTFRVLYILAGKKGLNLGFKVFCSSVPQGRQSNQPVNHSSNRSL